MATKAKSDVKVVKGQEAEDKVLEYVRRMNRPYGAVDVAANLKGAVPKTATQKILVNLAEKGELVQKQYGKTTFFVVNQAKIPALGLDVIASLEEEIKTVDEETKILTTEVRSAATELTRLKTAPSDSDLDAQLEILAQSISTKEISLEPLRKGSPLISPEDVAQMDAKWQKYRLEWTRRRKVFMEFWHMAADVLPPQDATDLAENLGIEWDTPEHVSVEHSSLCTQKPNLLKRKR